jgi:hypothetical protein
MTKPIDPFALVRLHSAMERLQAAAEDIADLYEAHPGLAEIQPASMAVWMPTTPDEWASQIEATAQEWPQ